VVRAATVVVSAAFGAALCGTCPAAIAPPAEAQLVVSTGAGRGVAESYDGVYTTADDGARWANVTPPAFRADPILLGHVLGVAAFGSERVWLLVSADAGYGTRLVYTWDAGGSWRATPLVPGPSGAAPSFLPGGASAATPTFSSADDGWILGGAGPGKRGRLFRTRDGGVHWSFVAGTPFRGSVVFTDRVDGWGVGAPGGALYRSTDGGVTWRRARLGRGARAVTVGVPTFFGPRDGVVAATRPGAEPVVVYTTSDGGARWHGRPAPTRRGEPVSFAASSAARWALYAGSTLYTTADAGRTWTSVHPRLPAAVTGLDRLASAGPAALWAQAHGHRGDNYPTYLLRSVDGGRTWSLLSP
jgi:photosystem II stability/assembly factor-like uncharacterized protein